MDERAASRVEVDQLINVCIGQRSVRALLYNLSIGGCMIEFPDDRLRLGDEVALRLTHNFQSSGRTVWHYGRYCGIRFGEAIPDVIVRHLGFKLDGEGGDFDCPVDRFGRPLAPLEG